MNGNCTSTSNGGNSGVATAQLGSILYVALSRCGTSRAFLYNGIQASNGRVGINPRLATRSTVGSSIECGDEEVPNLEVEEFNMSMQNMQVITNTNGVSHYAVKMHRPHMNDT